MTMSNESENRAEKGRGGLSAKRCGVVAAALAAVVVGIVLWRFAASRSATANISPPASTQSSATAASRPSAPSTSQSAVVTAERPISASAAVAATPAPTMPATTSIAAMAPSPVPVAEPAPTQNRESGAPSESETLPAATALADRSGPLHPRIDEVTATRRMVAAHAPLQDPKVADPDSTGNRQILQTMLSKAIIRRDTNAANAAARQGN